MSNIKNWALEQIQSNSNVDLDLEFREALAGFHNSCDEIEEAIDNFLNKDQEARIAKFSYEHDKWLDQNGGGFHYA